MPVYDYRCESNHWTTALQTISARDDAPACHECASPTVRGIAPPVKQEQVVENGIVIRIGRFSSDQVWRDIACLSCGHVEDFMRMAESDAAPACVKCEGPTELRPCNWGTPQKDSLLQKEITGGWYDRGAGRWFNSKKERKQWMKDNGVECTEGADMMPEWRKQQAKEAALEAEHDANMARYRDDPAYRGAMARLEREENA